MQEFEVTIPAVDMGSYPVRTGSGILSGLWGQIEEQFGSSRPFVVTDANVAKAGHLDTLIGTRDVGQFIIEPAGEVSKNIDTIIAMVETMEKAFMGRDTVVVALGGGTVGDMGAFAASIFKRGVPVIQVPTTTVSQADSAIGGKSGVDSSMSKNAFGTFKHPAAVYVDVNTLKTLNDRQYRAGLIESVKHAVIADEEYFELIENKLDKIIERDSNVLLEIAEKNCRIKATVVEADPYEKNQRRMLNYGHTVGHAVESVSGFELLHGEAVGIGMIAAGLIEDQMGLGDKDRLSRIKNVFKSLGVPVTIPAALDKNELLEALKRDKKSVDGWPRFVLVEDIGKVYCKDSQYAVEVGQDVIEKVIDEMTE